MNRRGQMLILLSTIVVGITVVYFIMQNSSLPAESRLQGVQQQHQAANSMVVALERTLLPRIVLSAANAALRSIIVGLDESSAAMTQEELDDLLTRLMRDGEGRDILPDSPLYNRTLRVQLELFSNLSNDTVRLAPVFENVDDIEVHLFQDGDTNEWNVRLETRIEFSLNSSVAYWYRNATIVTNMSIMGLPDPYLYRKGIAGDVFELRFNASEQSPRGVDLVRQVIGTRQYFKDARGLCFIDRLRGNEGPPTDPACGLAAFVNTAEPFPSSPATASYLDYCFFNEEKPRCGTTLREAKGVSFPGGPFQGFMLDVESLQDAHELQPCGLQCTYVVEDDVGSWDCQNGQPSCAE